MLDIPNGNVKVVAYTYTNLGRLKYRVESVNTTSARVIVVNDGKYADVTFMVADSITVSQQILKDAVPNLISRVVVQSDTNGRYGADQYLAYTVDDWDLAPRLTTVTGGDVVVAVDGPHVIRYKCQNSSAGESTTENMYTTTIVSAKRGGGTLRFRKPGDDVTVYRWSFGMNGKTTAIPVPGTEVVFTGPSIWLKIEGPETANEYDL